MAAPQGSNSRTLLRKNLLKNHKDGVIQCFERYRKFVNGNPQFRSKFFRYLKREILTSLDDSEKQSLFRDIQISLYSNQTAVYPINASSNTPMGSTSYSMNKYIPYPSYSNDDRITDLSGNQYETPIHQNCLEVTRAKDYEELFDSWDLDEDTVISRSTEPIADGSIDISNVDSLPYSISISVEDLSDSEDESSPLNDPDKDSANDKSAVIKQLFNEITDMIKYNKSIIKKLQNTRNTHGKVIYQDILNYVPKSDKKNSYKLEPIIFQLVLKINTYESVLDHISQQGLLNLNLKNENQMSIYNVLLFSNLDSLCKFLVFMKNKNIRNNIKYIYSTSDELSHLWSSQTERFKNMSISENGKDQLQVPQSVINGKSQVEDSYLKQLAQIFSGLLNHIDAIFKIDSNIIVESSFFVMLAQMNINHVLNFLQLLISVYKVEKQPLCRSIQLQSYEGKTVASIIENNSKTEFEKSVKFIKEFIEKYKKDSTKDQHVAAKKR